MIKRWLVDTGEAIHEYEGESGALGFLRRYFRVTDLGTVEQRVLPPTNRAGLHRVRFTRGRQIAMLWVPAPIARINPMSVDERGDRRAVRTTQKRVRGRARSALARVRAACKAARVRLRGRVQAHRDLARERTRADVAGMRATVKGTCSARRSKVRASRELALGKLEQRIESIADLYALRAKDQGRTRSKKYAARAAERRTESDDEVRANLPAELLPVFEQVKRSIKAGPRRSRTEAFLEWVEANENQIAADLALADERRQLAWERTAGAEEEAWYREQEARAAR